MEKLISVHWFVQVNRQKTTGKMKITYFLKNYVASLFFICKFLKIAFFTARYLDVRFWDLLYFICFNFNPQYWLSLEAAIQRCSKEKVPWKYTTNLQ